MPKTPMHQSADDTWLALGVALDKLERVESERDELRALVEHRDTRLRPLCPICHRSVCPWLDAFRQVEYQPAEVCPYHGAAEDLERFRALARGYMDERDELRAELAEWHAHDCRNIARGFDSDTVIG